MFSFVIFAVRVTNDAPLLSKGSIISMAIVFVVYLIYKFFNGGKSN